MTGVDLLEVDGVGDTTAQIIITEIGNDLTKFPTSKHFCSWLGLCPNNKVGRKIFKQKNKKNQQ